MGADLVIRGGSVHDGAGGEPVTADVVIAAGRVAAIGDAGAVDAPALDARGLSVAPGFIDIHSHSDYTLLVDPRAVSAIHQGVTLEVVGNCGYGCFPVADPVAARTSIYGYSDHVPLSWRDAAGYMERLEQARPAVNVATLVPNAQLRMTAMEAPERRATPAELARMRALLEASLDAGAWGYSTGLEYPVEEQTTEAEVAELCGVVAVGGGLYATHTRGRNGDGRAGVEEALRAARESGVRLQVSHLLPRAGLDAGRACLALVQRGRDVGIDVSFDQHTRPHGFTYLHVALPPWALAGGPAAIGARLRDADERRRMRDHRGLLGDDWTRVILLDSAAWPQYARRDVASIAAERGQEPVDAVHDLLLGAVDDLHGQQVILPAYAPAQQREAFAHPLCAPASDATTLAPDGPLAASVFHGAYTWAAWYWRFMVREGPLAPGEAVRRLTALPAQRLGLSDRGTLRPGGRADVAVFDSETFGERGGTFEPNRLAEGMVHVVVNGSVALRDGVLTGERAGAVLRHR